MAPTQHEKNILDQYIKGVNIRVVWALVVCTAVSCSTVLSIYFSLEKRMTITEIQLQLLNKRIERLEERK